MNKKTLKILGTIIAFAFCFALHFLYEKFPNFITSIFAPVNESIWEHMKILFGSIMLSSVVQKIIVIKTNSETKNICFSNFIGALCSIPIFLIIFLPIYSVIGKNMFITILIMLITLIISQIISYKIMNQKDYNLENKIIFFVALVYVIFAILTYFPPNTNIFIDPTNLTTGIKK